MTLVKVHHITRAIVLTGFFFLIIFLGLEYGLSLFFTQYSSRALETERKHEFTVSWNQYFEQRKNVLVTGLDGYANWSFLSDNILKRNDKEIEDAFTDYIETLKNDYLIDFMSIYGMDKNMVFSFYENLTSRSDKQKIENLRIRGMEEKIFKDMEGAFQDEKKKCEETPGSRSKVWCSILQYHEEMFLIAYSYIADDNGLVLSPNAVMVVGVKISKILNLASGVIPANFRIFKDSHKDTYLEIAEKGFLPGENFYISVTPNLLMQDIIKDTIFWMMMVQIAVILLLIVLILPMTVKLYTRQLQEVIDTQTCELTAVNEKQSKLIKHLQDAFSSIRTLEGLIPICASCKRIRNDNGYWEQVEEYIRQHSEANFSHGICPDCVKKLYPAVAAKKEKMEKEKQSGKSDSLPPAQN